MHKEIYIPSYRHQVEQWGRIYEEVKDIENKGDKSFVDIGCGYPAVSLVMESLGFKSSGIEINEATAIIANTQSRVEVICMDMLNITELKEDIIYMYNPIANPTIMKEAIDVVIRAMKKDAILLFCCESGIVRNHLKLIGAKELNEIFKLIKK